MDPAPANAQRNYRGGHRRGGAGGSASASDSDSGSSDDEHVLSEDEHQLDDMNMDDVDGYWDDIPLAQTQYDAYAGDVWAAGVCLLVMCTGRAPFPSLALPPARPNRNDDTTSSNNVSVETIDWALNAWNEGVAGRRRFWEMMGTLQPSVIKEIPQGIEDMLNGMLELDPRKRTKAQLARAHRWTRTGGNHARNHVVANYVRYSLAPTLHGVSGGRDLAEKQMSKKDQQVAAVQAAAEARSILGGTSAEFDLESDDEEDDGNGKQHLSTAGVTKRKQADPNARGAARLLRKLGNKGLSFYQANAYAVRHARRSRIEQLQQMNKRSERNKDESKDKSVLRSSLEQLGVQRAKLLALGDQNDAIYPHLETMWSRSVGKQIMVRLPPQHNSKYGEHADEDADLFERDSSDTEEEEEEEEEEERRR